MKRSVTIRVLTAVMQKIQAGGQFTGVRNIFVFANRYAPSNVELYYNDYNEWYNVKINGIIQLLEDVKNTQGARIDGMGMQGHYQTEKSPSADEFERAARTFARIVGKVQVTELDMAASASYDGTDATRDEEFDRQAKRYQKLYQAMQKLKADGVNISGMTVFRRQTMWAEHRMEPENSVRCCLMTIMRQNLRTGFLWRSSI